MKKLKAIPAGKRPAKTGPQTQARLNQHSRRRVVRVIAGAVIGGVIAGPIGVALGAAVGATSRRTPRSRTTAGSPGRTVPSKPVKRLASPKSRTGNPAQRKLPVNIYPNIP